MTIFSKIDQKIKCTGVNDMNHSQDDNNPIRITMKTIELDDYFFGELPSLEGIDSPYFLHLRKILPRSLMILL